ncbi:MAG: Alkanesulfonate monooxygenase [Dactylosporangium sp.]|nr:Alkanesulfonate monooxygenase [Dactylosporangium sp.]
MEAMASVDEPMLEGYTMLGYLAAKTERMRLGVLVTGVMYRYPGLLAEIVTTLDVLSSGRARRVRAGATRSSTRGMARPRRRVMRAA